MLGSFIPILVNERRRDRCSVGNFDSTSLRETRFENDEYYRGVFGGILEFQG